MGLEHAKSNFKLLLPYLEKVDRNEGKYHFRSLLNYGPDLVIEKLKGCDYHMAYEGDRSMEIEFSVYYDREEIIPIRYFNSKLNVFDNSNYWKTTFECFYKGNRNIPNVNALIEVDVYLSKWISDLQKRWYRIDKIENSEIGASSSRTTRTEKTSSEEYSKEVSFDNNEHTLFICKGMISCERKNHKILSATGILVSLRQEAIPINVNFCDSCKKYFISLDEYKYYQKRYGNLLGNFAFEDIESSKGNGFEGMAEKSVLNLCGYNVNMVEDIPVWDRRLILENIMVHNIVSKPKIIEYLNMFISSKKNMMNMESAIRKWTDDLEWVRQYNINEQRHFIITNIKKYH